MKKAGMVILLAGIVLLVAVGLYFFFVFFLLDPDIYWFIKLPVVLVVMGLLLVLISVITDRARENDRYKEVER